MNSIIKKAAAIALAAALTTGALPPGAGGGLLQKPANEAYAADAYTFDGSTGLLTLRGEIPTNNESVRRDFDNFRDKVKKVVAAEGTRINSGYFLFDSFVNCTEIDLSKADTSSCWNFTGMFQSCSSLKKLNISGFNTSEALFMEQMFSRCSALEELDLSSLTVKSSGVKTRLMFFYCESLVKLTLGNGFSQVTSDFNLSQGEYGWSNAKTPDTVISGTGDYAVIYNSGINTYIRDYANIPTTDCYSYNSTTGLLTLKNSVDKETISKFAQKTSVKRITAQEGTKFVGDCSNMFADYSGCIDIDLSNVNTSKMTSMKNMFNGCGALKNLDLTGVDTSKVTDMSFAFTLCTALETIDLGGFKTSNVTNMAFMFLGCKSLKNIDIKNFSFFSVKNISGMFSDCTALESVNATFEASNCTNFSRMFAGCKALKELDLRNLDTSKAEKMDSFFENCDSLSKLYLGSEFGDVVAAHRLPNGGGWVNGKGEIISGSGEFAEISKTTSSSVGYYKMTQIKAENYNLTGIKFPAPGTMVKDSLAGLKSLSDEYTVDKENTGWVDAVTGEKLDDNYVFVYGGAYFLSVRLKPNTDYVFAPPEEMTLVLTDIYGNDGTTVICEGFRYSGKLCENGEVEFAAYLADWRNTQFVAYEYPDGRRTAAYPLVGLRLSTPDAHTVLIKDTYNAMWQEPTGAPTYLYSVDKENWYTFAEINGVGIGKLRSDTEYTVYVKVSGESEPFYSKTILTPIDEGAEPIYKVDITDVVAPVALELPAESATSSGEGSVICFGLDIPGYSKNGVNWTDDDGSGDVMPSDAKFLAGNKYSVRVLVSAEEGYVFPEDLTEITATVNGKPAEILSIVDGRLIVVTYQFTATGTNTVTVRFDANGGSGTMEDVSVAAFTGYALPECGFTAPEGKGFAGWKIGETVYAVGDTGTFDANTLVTAVWAPIKYTITLAANGGNGEMAPVVAEINTEAELPKCTFTFKNKRFTGWFVNGEIKQAGEKIKVTGDITLYAMWEYNNVSVKFDANGGEGSIADFVTLSGYTLALPACTFTAPEGKVFAGWKVGEKTYSAGDSLKVTANTVVKAIWSEPSAVAEKILLGDVDGSGNVDLLDAELLARYVNGWDGIVIDIDAADLDRDGKVDVKDAMILARAIAAWDGYNEYLIEIEK